MTIAELLAVLRIKPDKKSFDAADKLIGGVKTALAGLAAYAGVNALKGFVQDTTALGGKLSDMSAQSNASAEELQELGYAAQQSGGSLEGVNSLLTKLGRNIYEAANGNKELAKSFNKAGIAVKNADGTLRPAADVLGDISDHLASADEGARAGIAMELAGRGAAENLPWLIQGSEALAALREEAHELGGVMSNETVAALDEFGDEQDKVKTALVGLRNEAVAALLPTLKEMVADVLAWVKANKKIIAQKLTTILKVLAKGFVIVGKAVGFVVDVLAFLGEHADITAVAVIALAAAMAIFKAASIGAAIASAAAWVLATLPLLLMAAAIAAVILIVEDLYNAFTGGESVLADLWDSFKTWVADGIVPMFLEAVETIKQAFSDMMDWIKGKLEEAKDWIVDGGFAALGLGGPTADLLVEKRRQAREAGYDTSWGALAGGGVARISEAGGTGTGRAYDGAQEVRRSVVVSPKIEMKIEGKDPEQTARVIREQVNGVVEDLLRQAYTGVGGDE